MISFPFLRRSLLKKRRERVRLAVHLHLFYLNQWEEIKDLLRNLNNYNYDLFVTLPSQNIIIEKDISNFHINSHFYIVENKGYDIGPFIYFLHQICLENYDLILKLHTKSEKGGKTILEKYRFSQRQWRKLLLYPLLKNKKRVEKNIQSFQDQKNLGMLASRYLVCNVTRHSTKGQLSSIQRLTWEMFGNSCKHDALFIAGTMFFVRSRLMSPIKKRFTMESFEETVASVKDGTLAHTLERLLGVVISQQKFDVKGIKHIELIFLCSSLCRKILRFLFQSKHTTSGNYIVKICNVPVFHTRSKQFPKTIQN